MPVSCSSWGEKLLEIINTQAIIRGKAVSMFDIADLVISLFSAMFTVMNVAVSLWFLFPCSEHNSQTYEVINQLQVTAMC